MLPVPLFRTTIGQTNAVRARSPFLLILVAGLLLATACSSTTVVARDSRPAASEDAGADQGDAAPDDDSDATRDGDTSGEPTPDPDPTAVAPRDVEENSGFGLGGEDQIAGLMADCEADSDLACDILYQLSEFDSDEEALAIRCGGRSDVDVLFCTDDIQNEGEFLHFDVESPGLVDLVTACEEGDMTACDFLYFRSPIGSTFEQIGNTCGGRTSVALPDCRTLFAE